MSSRKNVLLVGNPGTGKSTIINGILGRLACKSGLSYGGGLTVDFNSYPHDDGVNYMDTPGLADVSLRQQAGEEIERALKAGGNYKIIFVMETVSGRVRPDDIAMIKTVLTAIKLEDIKYSMLFNKVSRTVVSDMRKMGPEYSKLMATTVLDDYSTTSVFFNPLSHALFDTNDVFAPPSTEMMKFLRNAPEMNIAPTDVAKLETDEKKFEELCTSLKAQIEEIKNDNEALQERIDQANERQRLRFRDVVKDVLRVIPSLIHRQISGSR